MRIEQLDVLIKAICPIDGISSNGDISFCASATAQERLAAQAAMDANIAMVQQHELTLSEAVMDKIAQVTTLQNSKLFTNFDAAFPAGTKTIQIRNGDDWLNILTVMTRAMCLPAATNITFKTLDNVTQTLTAAQFIVIGQAVMAAKEAIKAQGDAHDAAIRALAVAAGTDAQRIAAIQSYNITTGW